MKTVKLFTVLILIACSSKSIVRADFVFGEPTMVPNVNSDSSDSYPQISRDGLELYFTSNRDGASENIWISKRSTKTDPWGEPVKLDPPVNRAGTVVSPSLSTDSLELYLDHKDNDLWISTRESKDDPWGEPVKLSYRVNGDQYESAPFISSNGLLLFFSRGYSKGHVFVSKRASTADPWGPAEFFTPINSGGIGDVWGASPGQSEFFVSFVEGDSNIYFSRGTDVFSGDWDIWQVEVTPIVDLNGDGIVDALDVDDYGG